MNKVADEFERINGYEASERAAIYEYDAGMTRKQAEDRAKLDAKNEKRD